MIRKIAILSILLLCSLSGIAQKIKSFSNNPEVFINELQGFLKEADKSQGEALFLAFAPVFQTELYPEEQSQLSDIANQLLKKRVVDFESWQHLLSSIMSLQIQEEDENRKAWISHFKAYSKSSPNRESAEYLRACYLNFNDSLISDYRSINWKAAGGIRIFSMENEPHFIYSEFDLIGNYKDDSTLIENTSANFYPIQKKIQITGGSVYFARAGFGRDSVRAELKRVSIDLSQPGYQADSVVLHSLLYLPGPTEGRLQEQMSSKTQEANATFPRFESYNKQIKIDNIVEGVDYLGGFSMVGNKLFGAGSSSHPSRLIFKHENKGLFKVVSSRFRLLNNLISTEEARMTLYLKSDSISHPKMAARYIISNRMLNLLRSNEGLALTPISNSYHDAEMYFGSLNWKMGGPQITFGSYGGNQEDGFVESEQYFRTERMQAMQGLNTTNPLYYLQEMRDYFNSDYLELKEAARFLRMENSSAERFFMQMMVAGFVDYDVVNQRARIKNKTFEFILDIEGKRDYDVIRFKSSTGGNENARLSLLNFDLEIEGIEFIAVSDSQKVAMFPKGNRITMQENFNFKFDGLIQAGRFRYYGNEYFFNYDQFKVNMNRIDSMKFKVESFEPNPFGGPRKLVDVKNTLQDINGELFIDKSDNKSSQKVFPEFPIFVSGKESYVYYDRNEIYNKVYERNSFYVELIPFTIDSLDNTTTEGLRFDGTFVSAGIFPDMLQTVKVQRDYSLGFEDVSPPDGLSAYGGKGRFTNKISLSNKGLKGDGRIDYLTSVSQGRDFTFFPDSVRGLTDEYEIAAQTVPTQYPHVVAKGSEMRWLPKLDMMEQKSGNSPFAMYDEVGMQAIGTLAQSPNRLKGNAQIDFQDAQMFSRNFTFKERDFLADSSDFKVRASANANWGFSMKNAKSQVDFNSMKGQFLLNDPAQYFKFDLNQYIAFMDRANWDITAKSIKVRKDAEGINSLMVSINRAQDSLQYMAGNAEFSLINTVLEVYEATEIDVADARIFPKDGRVTIDTAADMRILSQSKVVASRMNQFHEFYESEIKIRSRKAYSGSGLLEYLDKDQTPWPLQFHTIQVNREGNTVAFAKVEEEDGFFMSPFFAFKGKVELNANQKSLTFDGQTLIQNTCDNIVTTWFPFRMEIDPYKIIIDLPIFGEDKAAERLYNGIFVSSDSTSGYSAFLSRASTKADVEIIRSDGQLFYDENLFSYVVARKERIENPDLKGNYLRLNNRECFTEGEGKLGFGQNTGLLKLDAYGVAKHNLNNDKMELDMLLGIEFPFEAEVLNRIAKDVKASGGGAASNIGRRAYRVAVNELLSDKEKAKLDEQIALYGAPDDLPKELQSTFVFNDVQMVWNSLSNSFLSEGNIGMGSILKNPINQKLEGTIELVRKRRGDELYIFFRSGGISYYFEYKRNVLQFYSTNEELLAVIRDMDPKKKRIDGPNNTFINISIASKSKMNRFLNR